MTDETLQRDSDDAWRAEGTRNGWTKPDAPAAFFRLPVIRDIRVFWHTYWMNRAAQRWASVGVGMGVPNSYDLWVLYAISRGLC